MDMAISAVYDKAETVIAAEAERLAAQENGSGLLRAASTRIKVISRSQYVISVTDESSKPVPDAQVSIRVLDGSGKVKKTLPAKATDAKGYAVFWFPVLVSDSKGEADIDVVVRADGYRTQATGKLSVQGGSYMPLTLIPDTGAPYLIQSTYNDQDIVRTANGIYTSPYIDCKNGLASQPFGLLTLASGLSPDSADSISGIRLLPLKEGSSTLYGLYLNYSGAEGRYRIGKFTYGLQIGLEVTSLAADYPVILPGDTFTSYIALRNTGMMPIYNFSIDYLTQPEDQPGAQSTFVTQIYVDMRTA